MKGIWNVSSTMKLYVFDTGLDGSCLRRERKACPPRIAPSSLAYHIIAGEYRVKSWRFTSLKLAIQLTSLMQAEQALKWCVKARVPDIFAKASLIKSTQANGPDEGDRRGSCRASDRCAELLVESRSL